MAVLSSRKPRRSASEWQEIHDRFDRSGLSARAFCAREALVFATFHRWREKLKSTTDNGSEHRDDFMEVTTSPDGLAAWWSVEVELPDGRILRMRG